MHHCPSAGTPRHFRGPVVGGLALAVLLPAALAGTLLTPAARAQRYVPTDITSRPLIKYADSLVSWNDRCPIRTNTLNLHVPPLYVNRRPIGFCWVTCHRTFVKGPEQYLKALALELPCAVHPERKAVLDSTTREFVNREIYFFSSVAAKAQFDRDPLRYCGKLTDPVSGVRFQPSRRSPCTEFDGRRYYFASDSTRTAFEANPGPEPQPGE